MDGQKKICGGLFAHKMSIKNRFRINGSASQLNKLVLKDSPYVQKLSGTHLYPRSRINTYINFKNPCHEPMQQPLVVRNHSCY